MKTIRLEGVIGWDFTAAALATEVEDEKEDLQLILNSPGGFILEGYSIYNQLLAHKGKVNIQIDWAGSMASLIAMAGDFVTMFENTSMMFIHRPSSCACGTADDLRGAAVTLDKMESQVVAAYLEKAGGGIDEAELLELMDAETYLTANEAKNYGFIDKVIKNERKSEQRAQMIVGGGVVVDIAAAAQKLNRAQPLARKLETCETRAEIEHVLYERFSRADAKTLVASLGAAMRRQVADPKRRHAVDPTETDQTDAAIAAFNLLAEKIGG